MFRQSAYETSWMMMANTKWSFFVLHPNKLGGIDLDRSIFIYKPKVLKFGGWRPREGRYYRRCSVTEVCVVAILCGFLVSGRVRGWRLVKGWRKTGCWDQWNGGIFKNLLNYTESIWFYKVHLKVHVSKGSYDKVRAEKKMSEMTMVEVE